MKKIVSGLQSTSSLTLGNYLGSIKNILELQTGNDLYIFIADLHSITIPFEPEELAKNRKAIAALYHACGLDFKKHKIFYQSDVIEHTHLAYLLMCHSYLGELNRMTQFKDKSLKQANKTEVIPTGLLIYPCLMAADILIYDADLVPVGDDQKQHLELTKTLALRMNNKYQTKFFKIPKFCPAKIGSKIMDLQDPLKKMSKSNENQKGTIFLLDDLEVVRKKIMSAKTDSLDQVKFDWEKQPGIANLLTIYAALSGLTIKAIEKKYLNQQYGSFKKDLANIVVAFLKEIQEKYHKNIKSDELEKALKVNAALCKKEAQAKINKIQKRIGLSYDK
ncbi:MAG: tryptophan--tRNA ligase [Mycoplasmoidaceae bacterium]